MRSSLAPLAGALQQRMVPVWDPFLQSSQLSG